MMSSSCGSIVVRNVHFWHGLAITCGQADPNAKAFLAR
jgi:hypothetical protein